MDNEGNKPAHYASDIPTLRVLIHYGAELALKNKYKETAQMTAKQENRNCVYQFLRLYTVERKTRPFKILSDRFGGYYKERLRRTITIDNWNTSEENFRNWEKDNFLHSNYHEMFSKKNNQGKQRRKGQNQITLKNLMT